MSRTSHGVWFALLACAAFGCSPASQVAQPNHAKQPSAVPPELLKDMEQLAHSLKEQGYIAGKHSYAGFLLSGEHVTLGVPIAADSCVTLIALATEHVRDLDAALYAADGELLGSDTESNARPAIQACSSEDAQAYYVMQLYEGSGSFLVVPFYGSRAKLSAAAAAIGGRVTFADMVPHRELAEDPLRSLTDGLRKRGYEPVGADRSFPIVQGERVRLTLPVESGSCYTLAAFGSAGIREIALRAMDEHGVDLSVADEGQPQAATQLCAEQNAEYSLESLARAGQGQVTVLVYRTDVITAGGEAGLWLGTRPKQARAMARPQPPAAAGH
ncbi:MAG TPA: hypothetical protein VJV78_25355 [Polyangiales bacterium]|nr:hypothetical protein [Polyangiales bacterium]